MNWLFKNIGIAFIAVIALPACRDEVILNLNTVGAIVVIEGKISNDSIPFKVRVTTTADYYSLDIPIVTNAFVTINGNDGSKDTLHHDSDGYYFSNYINPCKVGVSYTLNVVYKGKAYNATETCLPQNPIDSVKTIYQPKKGFFPAGYYLWEYTTEKPGKGDCYQWDLYQNDTSVFDRFYYLSDDQFLDGNGQYIASDFKYPFRLGDSIIFEQFAISRQFYNFLTEINNQGSRNGSPFSGHPANIGGNISNGALGYFAVRNVIRKRLVVK